MSREVLILGSMLAAILERTKYQDEVKNLSPEKWLKYAFVEIHRVITKLGIGKDSLINITTFQLKPGDILIMGSDGKDE